jgi:tRNA threonylcarbamoyl adenosine modification protein (Sua5/YciO/YrdC/YwlC family)
VSEEIEAAVGAARAGALVVIPTDTVYGIGTRPDLPEATARIFEAKQRSRDLELPVLVASPEAAALIAELGAAGRIAARAFWPGPLTIVVRRTGPSRDWDLGGDPDTVGVRMPDHPRALAVLERTGPLAVTSANLSGAPTPGTCEEVAGIFGDAVAAYVCDAEPLPGTPSTVVDLTANVPKVLRRGAISESELRAVLSR